MTKNTTKATSARRHSLPTTIGGFENLLIQMIEKRTAAEFDIFLMPQVTACAPCWMMTNRVHRDLMRESSLTVHVEGSKGQWSDEPHPLLPYYLKLQAELRLQFEALGLNYRATPSKITEPTKKGLDADDPMAEYYKNANK